MKFVSKTILVLGVFVSLTGFSSSRPSQGLPYKGSVGRTQDVDYFVPTSVEELHSVVVRLTRANGRALCTAEYIGKTTLLTAAHCILNDSKDSEEQVNRTYKGAGSGMFYGDEEVEVLAFDKSRDVAVLRTKQKSEKYLTIADRNEKILFKDTMMSFGYGAGVFMASNAGMIFPENVTELSFYNVSSMNGPTIGGMSGGTLLDLETGKLTGIVQGGYGPGAPEPLNRIAVYVPAPVIRDVLEANDIELGK